MADRQNDKVWSGVSTPITRDGSGDHLPGMAEICYTGCEKRRVSEGSRGRLPSLSGPIWPSWMRARLKGLKVGAEDMALRKRGMLERREEEESRRRMGRAHGGGWFLARGCR